MLKTFNCPKCGAPVSYEQRCDRRESDGALCSYCNSQLSVPDEMRGRPAQVIVDFRGAAEAGKTATKWILVLVISAGDRHDHRRDRDGRLSVAAAQQRRLRQSKP